MSASEVPVQQGQSGAKTSAEIREAAEEGRDKDSLMSVAAAQKAAVLPLLQARFGAASGVRGAGSRQVVGDAKRCRQTAFRNFPDSPDRGYNGV